MLFFSPVILLAQLKQVPTKHVLTDEEFIQLLDVNKPELLKIQTEFRKGSKEKALQALTLYFKEAFAESYFFSWKNFNQKFEQYNSLYDGREKYHSNNANEQLELYPAIVQWKMPLQNLKKKEVTAYEYRHLARQYKASDIAFMYFYTHDVSYLNYIPTQAKSLNEAFDLGLVETIEDGNGTYEAYRAGLRMWNWLFAHQLLLSSEQYTWQQQLEMLKTFLHTAAVLYETNPDYNEGNHQTRGMSALLMVSAIFTDIKGSDLWLERSKAILEQHIKKEIYADGFQFERTVHYHIDDITNYLYPYQIAKINGIELGSFWDNSIQSLFNALLKIALPNKQAPVLQDDTNSPWSEFMDIDEIMAYGAALFNNPEYKYFASKKISSSDYWFLSSAQTESFEKLKTTKPSILSTELPQTGYFVMRQSWNEKDLYMIISAGLTPEKPDHQHGDMLGIQAYAYGNMVLPNYQVRYYLPDLEFFKNSFTKSVALVDSIAQGLEWTGNKGGSGFGKFKTLPTPKVLTWEKYNDIDVFIGEHNGFENLNTNYIRKVFFIRSGFWLVQDIFLSEQKARRYQQVWQGHFSEELPNQHYRSVFPNGAGLEIIQLADLPATFGKSSFRGKENLVFESKTAKEFTYSTLLFPFSDFENRLMETDSLESFKIDGWKIEKNPTKNTDAKTKMEKGNQILLLGATFYKKDNFDLKINSGKADIFLLKAKESIEIINCNAEELEIIVNTQKNKIPAGKNIKIQLSK